MPPKRKDTTRRNGLTLLPDPSKDPDAIKLGTLAFPVKATKGYTINSLKAKLKKHGVAVTSARPAAASSSGAPAYFDINNLFAVDVMHGSSFQVPRHLSIAADSIDAAMGDSMQQALRSIQETLLQTRGWLRGGEQEGLRHMARCKLEQKVERARAVRDAAKALAKSEPDSAEYQQAARDASIALRAAKEAAQVPDSQLELQLTPDEVHVYTDAAAVSTGVESVVAMDVWSGRSVSEYLSSRRDEARAQRACLRLSRVMAGGSQESLQLLAEFKVLLLYVSWQHTHRADATKPERFSWRQSCVDTEEQQQAAESLFQQTSAVTQAFDDAYREQQDFLQVVKELQQLCTFTHIKGSGNARGYRLRPCVAVGVDLLSGGRGRTAREGIVKFTVWTWPHSSPPSRIHRTIDSMPGEAAHHRPWAFSTLSAAADFGGQWKNKACTINDLDSVFDEWLQQAAEWDGYSKRDKEAAPLLVQLLKTGPQEPAQQPRGFAAGLTLKPHQLQALALMQAAEARPLGFNDVVWREVTLAGRSWWVSLATNKISSSPPPKQATGGILALEMGLGKTLCCLAVILANPAPAFGPGNTAPGCFLPDEALLQQPDGDAAADDDAKSCDEDEADEEAEEADAAAGEPAAAAAAAAVESGGAAEGDGEAQQQAAGTATVAGLGPLRLRYSRATLVVCAVSLVGQWADEADRRTAGNLRICQYHGSGRFKYSEERLATDFDIVVTTYSILCAEFGGKRGSNRFSASGSP
ncbi:hypothetical protein OEZ86_010860 [Tetradesmus obliquus]|nr:hypothetical protein OEZ86_010860 [Tetradesmus obliquus]